MKILHVNYSDDDSGAAIAVKRIHNMLTDAKINSEILVYKKKNQIYLKNIDINLRDLFQRILKKILTKIFNLKFFYTINFGILSSQLYKKINSSDAPIVNLHWIGNEMMSIKDIFKINKKIIWTLHDMWPYTSVENYIDKEKFNEKYISKNKNLDFFCKFILKKKIKYFKNIKLIICASKWQKELCEKSIVFKNAKKILIPLPLNFVQWKLEDKISARKELNIPVESKVIFFSLSHKYAAKRKGLDYVKKYLERCELRKIFLITTNCKDIKVNNSNFLHLNFENLKTIEDRNRLYSATDVFLMPSRLESFGQSVLEAQACGCPAVTFKNTGCEDIIEHLKTGYTANYLDFNDFQNGINWCLNENINKNLIRSIAEKKFSDKVVSNKYSELIKYL